MAWNKSEEEAVKAALLKAHDGQITPMRLFELLVQTAATLAQSQGICEGHFLEYAQAAYRAGRAADSHVVVECGNCKAKNRLRGGFVNAICAKCKMPLIPGLARETN